VLLPLVSFATQDFSNTDFVLDARSFVKPGDTVTFHVRYVSPSEKIVTGAFFAVRHSCPLLPISCFPLPSLLQFPF
jgi:hypothetical protein